MEWEWLYGFAVVMLYVQLERVCGYLKKIHHAMANVEHRLASKATIEDILEDE